MQLTATTLPNSSTLSLADIVAALESDYSALAKFIKSIPPLSCANGDVTIHGHYLPFQGAQPRVGELLDQIALYICNFSLSRSEISQVHELVKNASPQAAMLAYNKLRDSAADLFIKAQKSTNRNGECGELILYLLTEWILKAPQLLAKMSFKTTASMPVHSSDGIHIKFDEKNDQLIFFWGEAKVHKTINGAIGDAVSSISGTLKHSKLKEDINLVRRFISTTGLSAQAQSKIVEYLDPLSDSYNNKKYASTCLIGFNFSAFGQLAGVASADIEQHFVTELSKELSKAVSSLESLLSKNGISHHRMEVFFLPLESVSQFRDDWQQRIGWTKIKS